MLPVSLSSLGAAKNGAWMNRELYTIPSAESIPESSGGSSSEEEGGQSRSNPYSRMGIIVKRASMKETSIEMPGLMARISDDEPEAIPEPQYEDYESIVKNPSAGELSADMPMLRHQQKCDESENDEEILSLSDEDLFGRRTHEDDSTTIDLLDEEYTMRHQKKSSLTPYLTLARAKSKSTDNTSQSQDEFHGEGWSTGTDDTSTPDHHDFLVVRKMLSERNLRENRSNSAHSHDYVLQCISDESGSPPVSPQPYTNPRPEQRSWKRIGSMSKSSDEDVSIYTSDASTDYYSEALVDSSTASLSDAAHNKERERRHLYSDDAQVYILKATKVYPLTLDNVETFFDVEQSSRTSGLSSMDGPLSHEVTDRAFFSSALVPKVIPLKGQDEVSNFDGSYSLQNAPIQDRLAVVPFVNPSHSVGNVKDIETGDVSHVTELVCSSRLLVYGCFDGFDERSSMEVFFLWLLMTSTTVLILLIVVVVVGAL